MNVLSIAVITHNAITRDKC